MSFPGSNNAAHYVFNPDTSTSRRRSVKLIDPIPRGFHIVAGFTITANIGTDILQKSIIPALSAFGRT